MRQNCFDLGVVMGLVIGLHFAVINQRWRLLPARILPLRSLCKIGLWDITANKQIFSTRSVIYHPYANTRPHQSPRQLGVNLSLEYTRPNWSIELNRENSPPNTIAIDY